jgi:hypothetical protein
MSSKEICDDIDILVANDIDNKNIQVPATTTTTEEYEFNNDKFEDSASNSDYDSSEKQEDIETENPIIVNSITQITRPLNTKGTLKGGDKDKKKKKKKPGSGSQLASQVGDGDADDEEEDCGDNCGEAPSVGTMMMGMMTMMAVFNPLNFGVWGIVLAPMAAMLFGGICYGMYHYTQHKEKSWPSHPPPWPAPWPKPQEIIIKNKINHSPIPIKVMHLHKHSAAPPPMIIPDHIEIHGPPMSPYKSKPHKSYGEPPSDYHPSAPSGGPYKRKSNIPQKPLPGPSNNSYKFKLL